MNFYHAQKILASHLRFIFSFLAICHCIVFPSESTALKTNGYSPVISGVDEIQTSDMSEKTEIVRVEKGNVYEKPSSQSTVICSILKGDIVTILHQESEWLGVMLNDKRLGWVHISLFEKPVLTKENPEPAVMEPTPSKTKQTDNRLRVKVSMGRVREKPSLDAGVDFGLQQGTVVSLIDAQDDWYFIQDAEGRKGWAHKSIFESSVSEIPQDTDSSSDKLIRDIRFETNPGGEERVVFWLNGFNPPKSFALEEDIPKVVCDFQNTELSKSIGKLIKVSGNFIDQIRIGVHKGTEKKIRVVLDLKPHKNYDVEQLFFKKDNTYVLIFK